MQQPADIHQLAGEAFVNEWFYKVMDSTRLVVSGFYKADSRLVYLGNAVVGDQAISEFLKALPPTKHHIETLDVQAVPVPNVDTLSSNILVSVGGRVVFGDSVSKQVSCVQCCTRGPMADASVSASSSTRRSSWLKTPTPQRASRSTSSRMRLDSFKTSFVFMPR
jgi:hypothetical protein